MIPPPLRLNVDSILYDTLTTCNKLIPLSIIGKDNNVPLICKVIVWSVSRNRGIYSASSFDEPGNVLLATSWRTIDKEMLVSTLVHEAVHQLLFHIESCSQADIYRTNSLAYSPWLKKERSGRLVWHGFWAFSSQFCFLANKIINEEYHKSSVNLSLLKQVSFMFSSVALARLSLEYFEVLLPVELSKVNSVYEIVKSTNIELMRLKEYSKLLEETNKEIQNDFHSWLNSFLSNIY